MADDPQFLLPSATSAPTKRGERGTEDDPGYVPGVEFDGYGRYRLPRPGGDPAELEPWTRVTTLSGMLTSSEGLRIWSERAIVRGIGMRSDLRAMLAAAPGDKGVQDEVIATAKVVAETDAPSRYGRALHRALEDSTSGKVPAVDTGEPFGRDLQAALACLDENGVRVRAVEALVINECLGYVGRLDALWEATLPDGRRVLRVGDLKTGKDINKPGKRHTHGAQLAMYVNATHVYYPDGRSFSPMPAELDREVGLILHVRDGVAQMHEIDLVTGWVCARTAVLLHRQRSAPPGMMPLGRPVRIEAPTVRSREKTEDVLASVKVIGESVKNALAPAKAIEESVKRVTSMPAAQSTPPEPERGPSGRKRRACSRCRQPGHTARTCPNMPEGIDLIPAVPGGQPISAAPEGSSEYCDCASPNGWTQGADRTTWVCGRCGRPSREAAQRVQDWHERLDAPSPTRDAGREGAEQAQPTLIERIMGCRSQDELNVLWQASLGVWHDEHTEAAKATMSALESPAAG